VLAALYVISIAKETSNYVGGDISTAVAHRAGIWSESSAYVKEMEERLRDYEREVNQLLLACADTGLEPDELSKKLEAFAAIVSNLHSKHIEQVIKRDLLPKVPYPYARVPINWTFFMRPGDVIMGPTAKPSTSQKSKDQQ
jgi:hypothetical protein